MTTILKVNHVNNEFHSNFYPNIFIAHMTNLKSKMKNNETKLSMILTFTTKMSTMVIAR